jgi:1-acyl-sn-glycerol-3-phosphate acyltransferase
LHNIVYSYPPGFITALVRDVILARRRSFHEDAIACFRNLNPTLKVFGGENIPDHGPCVITVNHYYRPGFHAEWIALGIAACMPVDMHWVMTGELTYPGKWYAPIGKHISKIVLARIARVYGFTTMPPMPARQKDVEARAYSVRQALEVMRQGNVILGLAPEGSDQPGGRLSMPAPGAGRFGLLLAGLGAEFIPLGAYEANGEFCLRFGEAYKLSVPAKISTDEKDCLAAKIIMEKIAPLLPPHLRGDFA